MKDTVGVTPFWNKLSISSHTSTGLQTPFWVALLLRILIFPLNPCNEEKVYIGNIYRKKKLLTFTKEWRMLTCGKLGTSKFHMHALNIGLLLLFFSQACFGILKMIKEVYSISYKCFDYKLCFSFKVNMTLRFRNYISQGTARKLEICYLFQTKGIWNRKLVTKCLKDTRIGKGRCASKTERIIYVTLNSESC